jgi:hypothetical protein
MIHQADIDTPITKSGGRMKMNFSPLYIAICMLMLFANACSVLAPAPPPTSTPVPTNTPQPTFTITPTSTATPKPTTTPDVAATQKAEEFQSLLANFKEKGYIGATEGESTPIKDFKGEFAQLGSYYKWWWPVKEGEYGNFIFSAHFKWNSSGSTADASGCGIGFGIKENGNHYAIFLDRENLFLVRAKGTRLYSMGTSGGSRYAPIPIPAKADFVLAVWDQNVTASVNGAIVNYILSSELNAQGKFAFSVLSGTNSGYGTRCEMTDIVFWRPK